MRQPRGKGRAGREGSQACQHVRSKERKRSLGRGRHPEWGLEPEEGEIAGPPMPSEGQAKTRLKRFGH